MTEDMVRMVLQNWLLRIVSIQVQVCAENMGYHYQFINASSLIEIYFSHKPGVVTGYQMAEMEFYDSVYYVHDTSVILRPDPNKKQINLHLSYFAKVTETSRKLQFLD